VRTAYINARFAPPVGALPDDGDPEALIVDGDTIEVVGSRAAIAARIADARVIDLEGRLVTPALIDAHTHLVFAGDRSAEFARRLRGESYAQIAATGGGILSTVRATRAAPFEALLEDASARAWQLHAEGVRTIEIKSGYGLTLESELKMLRVARAVADHVPVRVSTTLLAAHAVPPEFAGDADGYVDLVCDRIIPAAAEAGLADAVDVFCESIAFSPAQTERIFSAALARGLALKGHTEQLSHTGGTALAARFGARSVDHVEYIDADDIEALARASTIAMLLPLPFVHLGETQRPPVASLRAAGVPMAVASDYNPGSAPLLSLRLAMNLACSVFGLRADESLAGATALAARALGLDHLTGSIEAGKRAELLVWPVGVTPERLTAEFAAHVRPVDLGAFASSVPSYDVWRGRVDREDGPDARRWHQAVEPAIAGADLRGAVALIGLASDAGVQRNLGRPGAADGPRAVRAALANLAWHGGPRLLDAGDVACVADDLELAQADYAGRVRTLLGRGARVVGLGGGHEIAWASWQGAAAAFEGARIGVINLDAHLDLRSPVPRATSGTPFAQIAADCARRGHAFAYLCLGASRPNNTAALFRKAAELGAVVVLDEQCQPQHVDAVVATITRFAASVDAVYLTIDLDVLPAAIAPGVSAPAALGVPLAALIPLIDAVIATNKLRLADIAELNPRLDIDQRTARVAARIVHHLAERWSLQAPSPPEEE
jgi:imidazolonepropionase